MATFNTRADAPALSIFQNSGKGLFYNFPPGGVWLRVNDPNRGVRSTESHTCCVAFPNWYSLPVHTIIRPKSGCTNKARVVPIICRRHRKGSFFSTKQWEAKKRRRTRVLGIPDCLITFSSILIDVVPRPRVQEEGKNTRNNVKNALRFITLLGTRTTRSLLYMERKVFRKWVLHGLWMNHHRFPVLTAIRPSFGHVIRPLCARYGLSCLRTKKFDPIYHAMISRVTSPPHCRRFCKKSFSGQRKCARIL